MAPTKAPITGADFNGLLIAALRDATECRMNIRLLVADDHRIVRTGLKSLLRDTLLGIRSVWLAAPRVEDRPP